MRLITLPGPNDREVVLSSELSIRATAPGSATWRVPVGGAREISATLDGRPVPVFMEAGGRQAAIPIQGSRHVPAPGPEDRDPRRDGPVDTLEFPVNPLPSARLIVDGPESAGPPRLLNARGNLKIGPDSVVNAELGPADHVEIQWGNADAGSPITGLTVDGVILWDIEPAGDRIQARFTYRGTRRLSTLRFKMDPGLIVRSARIPGMITGAWSGTADQPVWTVRLDPPLPEGAHDRARPLAPAGAARPARPSGPPGDSSSRRAARRFPLLEPLQAERFTSLLGVRRPSHWTGRLEAPTGAEALSDESFVKIWGPLPDERLTLSGTTRLVRDKLPTFRTGPAPALVRTRPTLELRIDAGRIDVLFDAEIVDLGGSVNSLALTVPQDLIVLGVESDGLTDWSRPEPRRLLLRFDREAARSRRRLKISGWIPTARRPAEGRNSSSVRMPTPWLDIPGMETLPGLLVIASNTRIEPIGATRHDAGLVRSAAAAGAADERATDTYRVDDPARLGTLQWTTSPPRVNVLIESQMTIHPDSAEWVAALRYDVAGGALDSIHVKLPTAWALKSQIQFPGGEFHPQVRPAPAGARDAMDPQTGASHLGISAVWCCDRRSPWCPARRWWCPRSHRWGRGTPTPTSDSSLPPDRSRQPRARADCTASPMPAASRIPSSPGLREPSPERSAWTGRTGP